MQVTLAAATAKLKKAIPKLDGISQRFAVLVPVISESEELHVLYEVRASMLKHQPGEICFPGGRIEDGEDARQAAIRETCEELGVQRHQIEILAQLNDIVTPYGFLIKCFAAKLKDSTCTSLTPNPREVGELFTVPLSFLLAAQPEVHYAEVVTKPRAGFPFHLIPHGDAYPWRTGEYPVYFYQYNSKVIWGITARITRNLVDAICSEY